MAKKNGRWLISLVGLAIIIAGVTMSIAKTYFVLPAEVAHHAKDFSEMKEVNKEDHDEFKADIDSCEVWMGEAQSEIVGIKKDIGYLGEKIDDSILEQKTFQIEQRTMQKEILDKIGELKK